MKKNSKIQWTMKNCGVTLSKKKKNCGVTSYVVMNNLWISKIENEKWLISITNTPITVDAWLMIITFSEIEYQLYLKVLASSQ